MTNHPPKPRTVIDRLETRLDYLGRLAASSEGGFTVEKANHAFRTTWEQGGRPKSILVRSAFVARPGMVLSPLGQRPDIVGKNLTAVVEQILATDR